MRDSPQLDDEGIYRTLVVAGMERQRAARLVEFLPTVYTRIVMSDSGVKFSDMYRRRLADGNISQDCRLADEPVWIGATEFALDEVKRGLSRQDLFALAGRSPEFRAINNLLNHGSKLENIACLPLGLPWPEGGPDELG
jgi:hypothetical protein